MSSGRKVRDRHQAACNCKRKKSGAAPEARAGPARKGPAAGLLLLFLGAIFLFNGINLCSQFVRAFRIESAAHCGTLN